MGLMPFSPLALMCRRLMTMNPGATIASPLSGWMRYHTDMSSGFRSGVTRVGFSMSSRETPPSLSGMRSA